MDDDGCEIEECNSPYIWLDPSLLGDICNVPSSDVLPAIKTPLSQSSFPLVRLLSLSKIALRNNFVSGLLAIAGGIMSVHYRTIIKVSNSCCWYNSR